METVTCKATGVFTKFVEGYGQVHGDPDSSLKAATNPEVPEHVVQELVDAGLVTLADGSKPKKAKAAAEEEAPAEAPAEEPAP